MWGCRQTELSGFSPLVTLLRELLTEQCFKSGGIAASYEAGEQNQTFAGKVKLRCVDGGYGAVTENEKASKETDGVEEPEHQE